MIHDSLTCLYFTYFYYHSLFKEFKYFFRMVIDYGDLLQIIITFNMKLLKLLKKKKKKISMYKYRRKI